MIDHKTVDEIMSRADIVEVISDFVTLRKAGSSYKGLCPFHNEKTPSFVVTPSKGIFHCFGCGKGGTVVTFLMEHEQMTYPEALRWLAHKYNIDIQETELTPEEIKARGERESLFIVNEWANHFFQQELHDTQEGQSIGLAYFRQRGLRDDIIRKFQLGYSPEQRNALATEALKQGYREEYLLKTGLCFKSQDGKLLDKYHGRVMYPVMTVSGKIVAFGGRILGQNKNVGKYINSPESEIYNKSNELYGLYQAKSAISKADRCYLVEGYMDVISMHQNGVENVVASSGTSLTYGQIRGIKRFTQNITVLYDGDSAGIHAGLRAVDMLLEEGLKIKVLVLPDGDDPDSFSQKHPGPEFQQYLEDHQQDFIRFKTSILLADTGGDPLKRGEVTQEIVNSIALIPNEILRSMYIQECSRVLNVREDILISATDKARRKHYQEKYKEEQQRKEREERLRQQMPDAASSAFHSQNGQDGTSGAAFAQSATAINATSGLTDSSAPPTAQVVTSNASQQVASTTSPTALRLAATDVPRTRREKMEQALMRNIIRYGELPLEEYQADDGSTVYISVLKYIKAEFDENEISFTPDLYRLIWQKCIEHCDEPGFTVSKYLLTYPDPIVSNFAAAMLQDNYELSKSFANKQNIKPTEDKLRQILPQQMAQLKLIIVSGNINAIKQQLSSPEIIADEAKTRQLMEDYQQYNTIKQALAKEAGETNISL